MATYETLFITPPNLAEDAERSTVEAMAKVVTAGGGTIVAQDRMGRRRLAYPINKFEDGVYIRLLYDAEADVPKELERRFRLTENVLRYLTVHLEEDWAQWEKQEAVREAKRRAEAEVARQEAAVKEAQEKEAKEAKEKEEAEKKAAEAAEAADKAAAEAADKAADEPADDAAEAAEPADETPAAEAAPAVEETGSDESPETPPADEGETQKEPLES